jgi:diguanylate cyclase (GGDEF)-like protein
MEEKLSVILIDDEDDFLFMTGKTLEQSGFIVQTAKSGTIGLQLMREKAPDLVLLDLNMPQPDGHQICDMIKNDANLRKIPVVILTSSDDLSDKLQRLDGGADDYITKYVDQRELEARIKSVVRRQRQNLDSNPLTHLPGNSVIQNLLMKKVEEKSQFTVAYTDLDNFKAFNDKYGFQRGDQVILFTARVLKESCDTDDFVGHIGGDDFVIITSPDKINKITEKVVNKLDSGIVDFYDEGDRQKGFVETKNRQGDLQKFPFVSISIAVTTNVHREFANIGEIVKVVTELKKFAKQKEGSSVVYDKRTD